MGKNLSNIRHGNDGSKVQNAPANHDAQLRYERGNRAGRQQFPRGDAPAPDPQYVKWEVLKLANRLLDRSLTSDDVFHAILVEGTIQRSRDSGSPEIQFDQTGILSRLREAPCEINGGKCLAFPRAWACDEYHSTLWVQGA